MVLPFCSPVYFWVVVLFGRVWLLYVVVFFFVWWFCVLCLLVIVFFVWGVGEFWGVESCVLFLVCVVPRKGYKQSVCALCGTQTSVYSASVCCNEGMIYAFAAKSPEKKNFLSLFLSPNKKQARKKHPTESRLQLVHKTASAKCRFSPTVVTWLSGVSRAFM